MPSEPDVEKWSGEGTLTQAIVERLKQVDEVAFLRVEDAPASRSDADYNFISNEIFVAFVTHVDTERAWRFGVLPVTRRVTRHVMSMVDLERTLAETEGIGPPDYSDARMLQYMHSERIIPPYQTRGYKLVELVRIYEVAAG
jgi:hypothetical protein